MSGGELDLEKVVVVEAPRSRAGRGWCRGGAPKTRGRLRGTHPGKDRYGVDASWRIPFVPVGAFHFCQLVDFGWRI